MYGGVEAGGTKFICAIGSGYGEIREQISIDTTDPPNTLRQAAEFFKGRNVRALGVGSFGPIELHPSSDNFGTILTTTKPGWSNVNIYTYFTEALGIPTAVVTDTDAAAIGEQFHGKSVMKKNSVYLTIGTGVGGTVIVNKDIVHGISHPEMGHMRIPADPEDQGKHGGCSYHMNCFEGLASGKSIEIRTGQPAGELHDAEYWDKVARYIAYGVTNIISVLQPEIIILGGSVMKHPELINAVRRHTLKFINDYFEIPDVNEYIVRSSGDTIGVLGSIKLASELA